MSAACGYRPVASAPAEQRLCVRADGARVAYPRAVEAALNGARQELARHGALDDTRSGPCLVVSLLRVDEGAIGIAGTEALGAEQPLARGTAVSVLGDGWVESQPGAPPESESGDVRRAVHVETTSGVADALRHDQAVAAAAEQVGAAIARSVLGLPVARDIPP